MDDLGDAQHSTRPRAQTQVSGLMQMKKTKFFSRLVTGQAMSFCYPYDPSILFCIEININSSFGYEWLNCNIRPLS